MEHTYTGIRKEVVAFLNDNIPNHSYTATLQNLPKKYVDLETTLIHKKYVQITPEYYQNRNILLIRFWAPKDPSITETIPDKLAEHVTSKFKLHVGVVVKMVHPQRDPIYQLEKPTVGPNISKAMPKVYKNIKVIHRKCTQERCESWEYKALSIICQNTRKFEVEVIVSFVDDRVKPSKRWYVEIYQGPNYIDGSKAPNRSSSFHIEVESQDQYIIKLLNIIPQMYRDVVYQLYLKHKDYQWVASNSANFELTDFIAILN